MSLYDCTNVILNPFRTTAQFAKLRGQIIRPTLKKIHFDPVFYYGVNSSSHSVNGDIAIQWEWSNFDHS